MIRILSNYLLYLISVLRPFSSSRNVANVDPLTSAYGYSGNKFSTNRPGSMSETNLLKYRPQKDGINGPASTVRPESALGLLQGTYLPIVFYLGSVSETKVSTKKNVYIIHDARKI